MGLDMYLRKHVYIGADFAHNKVTGEINLKRGDVKIEIQLDRVSEIIEKVGYWRKANAIHKWFVDNVQNGVDDCGEYYVTFEKLQTLKTLCEKVIETKDASLLPPQSGFFFGSTEVDDWYFEKLKDTIKIISSLNGGEDYYYESSW